MLHKLIAAQLLSLAIGSVMPLLTVWRRDMVRIPAIFLILTLASPVTAVAVDEHDTLPGTADANSSETLKKLNLIHIAGGFYTGVYYAIGTQMCLLLNRERQQNGILCGVGMTGGSLDNRTLLENGVVEFGLMQSDLISYQPGSPLRGIIRLHDEVVYFALKPQWLDSALAELPWSELRIGVVGSGSYASVNKLLIQLGVATNSDSATIAALQLLSVGELRDKIATDALDGFVVITGKSSPFVTGLLESGRFRLYPLLLPLASGDYPAYQPAQIPAGHYPHQSDTVPTLSVHAILLSREMVADAMVEALLVQVHNHFQEFQQAHPSLQELRPEDLTGVLPLPLHPAAERYFHNLAKRHLDTAPAQLQSQQFNRNLWQKSFHTTPHNLRGIDP